jgi:hypothetical protein
MLPTDLSAETGVPPLTNAIEGTAEAGFPDEIAPRPDYVFLKRRPSAFYGTGVAELLHMLRQLRRYARRMIRARTMPSATLNGVAPDAAAQRSTSRVMAPMRVTEASTAAGWSSMVSW